MGQKVEIRGSGIAALACSVILRRFGWKANTPLPADPRVPYLVINSATGQLLRDVFQVPLQALHGHQVTRRLVSHHHQHEITLVNEPALVIDSRVLQQLAVGEPASTPHDPSPWRIFAGECPPQGKLLNSGKRRGWIFAARCRSGWLPRTTIFESFPEGWLFWAPVSARSGFIHMVLPFVPKNPSDVYTRLAARARLLKPPDLTLGALMAGPLPCAAACHSQVTGDHWIASGTSALRFDPISGDGTGASLRSALLACATLRASVAASDPSPYLEHYQQRLKLAFRRHLEVCASLYAAARFSRTWTADSKSIRRLLNAARSEEGQALRFCLRDYHLVPLAAQETEQTPDLAKA